MTVISPVSLPPPSAAIPDVSTVSSGSTGTTGMPSTALSANITPNPPMPGTAPQTVLAQMIGEIAQDAAAKPGGLAPLLANLQTATEAQVPAAVKTTIAQILNLSLPADKVPSAEAVQTAFVRSGLFTEAIFAAQAQAQSNAAQAVSPDMKSLLLVLRQNLTNWQSTNQPATNTIPQTTAQTTSLAQTTSGQSVLQAYTPQGTITTAQPAQTMQIAQAIPTAATPTPQTAPSQNTSTQTQTTAQTTTATPAQTSPTETQTVTRSPDAPAQTQPSQQSAQTQQAQQPAQTQQMPQPASGMSTPTTMTQAPAQPSTVTPTNPGTAEPSAAPTATAAITTGHVASASTGGTSTAAVAPQTTSPMPTQTTPAASTPTTSSIAPAPSTPNSAPQPIAQTQTQTVANGTTPEIPQTVVTQTSASTTLPNAAPQNAMPVRAETPLPQVPLPLTPDTVETTYMQEQAAPSLSAPSPAPLPYAGGPTFAQSPTTATVQADDGVATVVRWLLSGCETALAHNKMLQAASLPETSDARPGQATSQTNWMFEIPITTPQGTAVAQFAIGRDGGNGQSEAQAPVWQVRFSIAIEPLGPVHALVALKGERAWVNMWADRPASLEKLRDGADALSEAMTAADFEAEIAFQPQPTPQPRAGKLVDHAL